LFLGHTFIGFWSNFGHNFATNRDGELGLKGSGYCLVSLEKQVNWRFAFFHRPLKWHWDHLVTPHYPQTIQTHKCPIFLYWKYKAFCIFWCFS